MALIDFRQVAAPNFNDANSLMELAAKRGESAITGLQKTWEDAMGAVQNRNHAKMQTIINQQSAEDLQNPEFVGQLMQQFQSMAEPTGNNYDPTVIGAALDNRTDTLQKREGVMYDNMASNVGVQQGKEDLQNSMVTNKFSQDKLAGEAKAAKESKNQDKAYGIMRHFERGIKELEGLDTPEAKLELQALKAQREGHLAELYPEGIPPEVMNSIYEKSDEANIKNQMTNLNIEGKQYANADAATRIGLARDQFTHKVITDREKTGIAFADRAVANGLGANVITPEGKFNPGAANQDLMSRLETANRELVSPADSKPFSERVNETLGKTKSKDGAIISDDKLRQLQIALNTYSSQSKNGKSLQLTDDEKWAVFQGMLSGEIQSDNWITGDFGPASNFQGMFDKVIPEFLDRYKKQTIPHKQQLKKAEVVSDYFTKLGGIGDQVYMAEEMGITPNTELFMYLPKHIRDALDPKGTDKRSYNDIPTANDPAAIIESKAKDPKDKTKTKADRNVKPKTVYQQRNNLRVDW